MQATASIREDVDLLTIDETAAVLRVSDATVYRLMRRGDLAVIRIRRRTFIERRELDRLLETQRAGTTEGGP